MASFALLKARLAMIKVKGTNHLKNFKYADMCQI